MEKIVVEAADQNTQTIGKEERLLFRHSLSPLGKFIVFISWNREFRGQCSFGHVAWNDSPALVRIDTAAPESPFYSRSLITIEFGRFVFNILYSSDGSFDIDYQTIAKGLPFNYLNKNPVGVQWLSGHFEDRQELDAARRLLFPSIVAQNALHLWETIKDSRSGRPRNIRDLLTEPKSKREWWQYGE